MITAYKKLINKKDRSKFFVAGPNFCTIVMIQDPNIWTCLYKILASAQPEAVIEEEYSSDSEDEYVEKGHTSLFESLVVK